MNDRYQLVAYLATLATLVAVFVAALVAACLEPTLIGRLESFGLGTITGGLIGVLRLPQRPAGASDATMSAALDKVPDATPTPPASVTLDPGQTATVAAAPTQGDAS